MITNKIDAVRTMLFIGTICLVGCWSPSAFSVESAGVVSADDAIHIPFTVTNNGRKHLLEVVIPEWQKAQAPTQSPISDYVPYLVVQPHGGFFGSNDEQFFIEPSKLESAGATDRLINPRLPWHVTYGGVTLKRIPSLAFALCPLNAKPNQAICQFNVIDSTKFIFYEDAGKIKAFSFNDPGINRAEFQNIPHFQNFIDFQREIVGIRGVLSNISTEEEMKLKSESITAEAQLKARWAAIHAVDAENRKWDLEHPRYTSTPLPKSNGEEKDTAGRRIIRGPITEPGYYENVHVISSGYGIDGSSITITNSVIEADVCVNQTGIHMNNHISNNEINCR